MITRHESVLSQMHPRPLIDEVGKVEQLPLIINLFFFRKVQIRFLTIKQ